MQGTAHFHTFVDALASESESQKSYHETAGWEAYGPFHLALQMYDYIKERQQRVGPKSDDGRRETAQFLRVRPPSAEPPAPQQPRRALMLQELLTRPSPSRQANPPPASGSTWQGRTRSTTQAGEAGGDDERDDDDDDEEEVRAGTRRPDETCVTQFSGVLVSQLAAMRSSTPARQIHALLPHRVPFYVGHKTSFSVSSCVDSILWKQDCRTSTVGDDHVSAANGQHFTAEYKSTRYQQIKVQLSYEFAAKISSRYSKGGGDPNFAGTYVQPRPPVDTFGTTDMIMLN